MLIVGLGNPGREYVGTRHNVGRDFLIDLASREDFSDWRNDRYLKSFVSEGELGVILALPETFMNRSGEALRALAKKYSLKPEEIVVVYDDIDLAVGSMKISKARGDGGHNGVRSIIDHIGTNDFVRIRIGICPTDEGGEKRKPRKDIVSQFVLARFSPNEKEKLDKLSESVFMVIKTLKEKGVERSMNLFNKK